MKELRDQSAHMAVAAFALAPAIYWPNPFTYAWAGFCMGLVREVTEEGPPVTLATVVAAVTQGRSWLDLSFWTLGGFAVGVSA